MNDVAQWLEQLGLGQYVSDFAESDIDEEVLGELTDDDLKELGLTLGHRKKLLKAIAALRSDDATEALSADMPGAKKPSFRPEAPEAERRQLTVLFCDMVGSTALSGRLDPEDMRTVIGVYQKAAASEIGRFEGHVAKFMGDGVLAYFGYPRAHEDDAERAVRAALAVTEAVRNLRTPTGEALAVRIGIATGLVVVGDLIGEGASQEESVVGETPNLAARLQGIAQPNTTIIASGTRALLGVLFEYEDLGRRSLKGFPEPVQAWHVVCAKEAETRFEAAHGAGITPLVGRDEEMEMLLRRWHRAKKGEGQVVLFSGEPGIGKSRITLALRERIADEPHVRIRYQCSPYFTQSALFPFAEQLRLAAGFAREDGPEQKLDKMEAMLRLAMDDIADITPLFAALLSIPTGKRYPVLELAPDRWKERTFGALLQQMEGLARHQPMLLVFEDAHWIDPTSLELLDRAIERVQTLPILFIITFRPDFAPPWVGQPNVTLLSLNRMGRRECAAMVEKVTDGKALPDEVLDQIVTKTDGVPLFVEELTKTVLESGLLEEQPDRYVLGGPLPPLAIPTSLQDSLMARLDRMAPVKEVAQMAATIGREFSYDLLAAVSPLSENKLRDALTELARSELIFQRGTPPDARYLFKHALVRDAAYESLLKSRRQQLHQRIAQVLETQFSETAQTEPELLAHHFTKAGLAERAVVYWRLAGDQAAERSANREAISNYSRGLELLVALSESEDRDRQELALGMGLGPCLMTIKGFASPEVEQTYRRARELCDKVGEPSQNFPVVWGLWHSMNSSGRLDEASALAHELIAIGERQGSEELILQAHHSAWTSQFGRGELRLALEHAKEGKLLYDINHHGIHAFFYGGHDAGVCCRFVGAMALAVLGFPNQARDWSRESVRLAEQLAHPFSLAMARSFATSVCYLRREPESVQTQAAELSEICRERGFAQFVAMTTMLRGWSLAAQDNASEGIALIQEGLDAIRATGVSRLAFQLALLAEACSWAGEIERGLTAVVEAEAAIESTGERLWEAEVLRLKGRLLLAGSAPDRVESEASLKRAIDVARKQDTKWFELRAAMSLAQLWAEQGRRAEAHDLLAPIYGWFTEGFETKDLKDAKQLLGELRC